MNAFFLLTQTLKLNKGNQKTKMNKILILMRLTPGKSENEDEQNLNLNAFNSSCQFHQCYTYEFFVRTSFFLRTCN